MMTLSKREKTLLLIMGGVISIMTFYYLIITPIIEYAGSSNHELNNNLSKLSELHKIYENYQEIKSKRIKYESLLNNKNDNMTTLIQQWASSHGIDKNILYTKRRQKNMQNKYIRITTDIKFGGVPIQSLLAFIKEVEYSNQNQIIEINYLRMYPGLKTTKTYDAQLKIDTYIKK